MKSFEERLETESEAWVEEGLITGDQRGALLARHVATDGGGRHFLAILATIGGLLFAVGISLVIKSNWEDIGDWVKILGLVALLGGSYAVGWRLKTTPGSFPKTGEVFLMVGAIFFLLGIALVSQIFHLNSRPPNGVLLWWLGIVALPWLARSKGAQCVSVVAGLTWLFLEFETADSWLRLAATETRWYNHEYLVAAAGVFTGTALLFFGFGLRPGRHADFAGVHEKLGLLIACGSLYALGFTWSAHGWRVQMVEPARWPPIAVLGGLLAAAGIWAVKRNAGDVKALGWCLAVALVPAVAHLLGIELRDSAWLWGGLACVALFLLNLAMIRQGLATGREAWINLGMAGMALNIVTRYFLLFGSMLEGGVFFIVTGLLVLGLGFFLERKRRVLVGSLRTEVVS